jgi:hypothetical protein
LIVFFQAKRNTHVLKIEIIVLTLLVLLNIFNGHVMAFHSASGVTMQMSVVALIGEKTVSAAVSFLFTVAVAACRLLVACLVPGGLCASCLTEDISMVSYFKSQLCVT